MTEQLKQLSPEWFAARAGKITGSRVAAILGHSPWSTRAKVMDELLREYHGLERKDTSNVATEWGNDHEPDARAAYEAETGQIVSETGFHTLLEYDFIGVSPDGLVFNDGLERIPEFKCPYSGKIPDEVPEHYNDQCQLQMVVLDVNHCDLFYWTEEGTKLFPITFDPDWWAATLPILIDFYDEFKERCKDEYVENVENYDLDLVTDSYELVSIREQISELASRESELVKKLKAAADKKHDTIIGKVIAVHLVRRGGLDTERLASDHDINLDLYRKKDAHYISIKVRKES